MEDAIVSKESDWFSPSQLLMTLQHSLFFFFPCLWPLLFQFCCCVFPNPSLVDCFSFLPLQLLTAFISHLCCCFEAAFSPALHRVISQPIRDHIVIVQHKIAVATHSSISEPIWYRISLLGGQSLNRRVHFWFIPDVHPASIYSYPPFIILLYLLFTLCCLLLPLVPAFFYLRQNARFQPYVCTGCIPEPEENMLRPQTMSSLRHPIVLLPKCVSK